MTEIVSDDEYEVIKKLILDQLNVLLTDNPELTSEDILLSVKSVSELNDIDRDLQTLTDAVNRNSELLINHIADNENPHNVNKSQVSLNELMNFSYTNDPSDGSSDKYMLAGGVAVMNFAISNLETTTVNIQNSLNILTDTVNKHINNTANPHNVTKDILGMSNIENYPITSDSDDVSENKYVVAKGLNEVSNNLTITNENVKELEEAVDKTNPIIVSKEMPSDDKWSDGDLWFVYED